MGTAPSLPPAPEKTVPLLKEENSKPMSEWEKTQIRVIRAADCAVVLGVMNTWETPIPFEIEVGFAMGVRYCDFRDPVEALCVVIEVSTPHVRECKAWVAKQNLVLPGKSAVAIQPFSRERSRLYYQ
jgi:hypothetical protein